MKRSILVVMFRKGFLKNNAIFGRGKAHDLAPFEMYHKARGLRWPVVDGKETLWRFREGYDAYVKKGEEVRFYGKPDGKAWIFALPYEPPAEIPDDEYDLWLSTRSGVGALAFRHHGRVGCLSFTVPSRTLLSSCTRMMRSSADWRRGMEVKVVSRRGEMRSR